MAQTQLTLPVKETERLFRAVADVTRQTVPELLRDVMRLWANDLMRKTYPKSKIQSSKKIAAETSRLFSSITGFDSDALKKSFKAGNEFHIASAGLHFKPAATESELMTIRTSRRDKNKGTVYKHPSGERMIVKSSVLKAHLKAAKKNIGKLKLGWKEAVTWARGSIPSWLPSLSSQGSFTDALSEKTLQGHLIAGNNVEYANRKLSGSFMDSLLRARAKDLTSGKYAMRWKRKMESKKA